jgi:hypothetical protein
LIRKSALNGSSYLIRIGNLGDLKHSHNYNVSIERNGCDTKLKIFRSIHSSLLASVAVNVFHATEAYSSLDVTKVKYNVRILSVVEKEKVMKRIRPNNFKDCEDIKSTC